ncbi:MobA/MobL family protein [Ochrobactrum daejeonense]|nr:MobA/MobL family protein [Brucella daejeonensis]
MGAVSCEPFSGSSVGGFWNKVEASENRKDAQFAREMTLALPVEFSREQNIALVREFVEENFSKKGSWRIGRITRSRAIRTFIS